MSERVKVGLLGCGAIAPAYLRNLTGNLSTWVDVRVCADLDQELARSRGEEFGVEKIATTEDLLSDDEVELIVNLTPAPLHFKTSMQILDSGKHLFTEKPLCMSLEEGKQLQEAAKAKGLKIGGAPDTFLAGSFSRCKRMIESDTIGLPIAAQALVTIGASDSERYHKVFSGALLDLGPYYLTALVQLFGSVKSVTALADIRFPRKTDGETGKEFELDRASTVASALSFENGLVATLIATEDAHAYCPSIEIYGSKGKMRLSDANYYGKTIEVTSQRETRMINPSSDDGFVSEGRGLGVAEMAMALREGKESRVSDRLLYHILEVMLAVYESSDTGRKISIDSVAPLSAPLNEKEWKKILGTNA